MKQQTLYTGILLLLGASLVGCSDDKPNPEQQAKTDEFRKRMMENRERVMRERMGDKSGNPSRSSAPPARELTPEERAKLEQKINSETANILQDLDAIAKNSSSLSANLKENQDHLSVKAQHDRFQSDISVYIESVQKFLMSRNETILDEQGVQKLRVFMNMKIEEFLKAENQIVLNQESYNKLQATLKKEVEGYLAQLLKLRQQSAAPSSAPTTK